MSGLRRGLALAGALGRLRIAEAVAYRASLLVWILTTTFPLVSLALWAGIARAGGPIGGYGERDFVAYFVAAFIVRQVTASWVVWDLERSIRLGELSVLLLRPVHPLLHHLMLNLAALPVRLVLALPLAIVVLVAAGGLEVAGDPAIWPIIPLALAGGFILAFSVQAAVGCLAFWWNRSATLYEIWIGLFMVLSGYAVPTSLLPGGLAEVVRVLPFHAALGFPVELVVGRLTAAEALEFLAIQWAWVALAALACKLAWSRGIRVYGAYGA
ncbi:MAG: ABC-2 family transporter protein [Myxococcales bacterium]|nr:ABC-2 family transporter protein [Myxococcales bacterium]